MAIWPRGDLAIDPFLIGLDKHNGSTFQFCEALYLMANIIEFGFLTENICFVRTFYVFFGVDFFYQNHGYKMKFRKTEI